jgi:hypothetical protein
MTNEERRLWRQLWEQRMEHERSLIPVAPSAVGVCLGGAAFGASAGLVAAGFTRMGAVMMGFTLSMTVVAALVLKKRVSRRRAIDRAIGKTALWQHSRHELRTPFALSF